MVTSRKHVTAIFFSYCHFPALALQMHLEPLPCPCPIKILPLVSSLLCSLMFLQRYAPEHFCIILSFLWSKQDHLIFLVVRKTVSLYQEHPTFLSTVIFGIRKRHYFVSASRSWETLWSSLTLLSSISNVTATFSGSWLQIYVFSEEFHTVALNPGQ